MLGSGQYGAVFLATEKATFKQTACKIIDFRSSADQRLQITETLLDNTSIRELSADEKDKSLAPYCQFEESILLRNYHVRALVVETENSN